MTRERMNAAYLLRCCRGDPQAVGDHNRHVGYNSVLAASAPDKSNDANRQVRQAGAGGGAARQMGRHWQMGGGG